MTPISQEIGTRRLHLWTPVLPSHEVVGSSSTQDAPSPGLLNSSHKLPYLLLKPSTSLCHNLYVIRDIIPVMNLLQEMRGRDYQVICTEPHVYWKVFEDNSGAVELARLPELRPRTKHINVCYHHFRELVRKGLIKIFPIDTKDQIADALTKALAQNDFQRHCRFMCGK